MGWCCKPDGLDQLIGSTLKIFFVSFPLPHSPEWHTPEWCRASSTFPCLPDGFSARTAGRSFDQTSYRQMHAQCQCCQPGANAHQIPVVHQSERRYSLFRAASFLLEKRWMYRQRSSDCLHPNWILHKNNQGKFVQSFNMWVKIETTLSA